MTMSDYLAKKLRQWIKSSGLSHTEVSKHLGINISTLSRALHTKGAWLPYHCLPKLISLTENYITSDDTLAYITDRKESVK